MSSNDRKWKSSKLSFLLCSTLFPFLIGFGKIQYINYIFAPHYILLDYFIITFYSFWIGYTFHTNKPFLFVFPFLFCIFYGILPPLIYDYLLWGFHFILSNWVIFYFNMLIMSIMIIFGSFLMEFLAYFIQNPKIDKRGFKFLEPQQLGLLGGMIMIYIGFQELTCYEDYFSHSDFYFHPCWYQFEISNTIFHLLLISGLMTLILGIIACIGYILTSKKYIIGKYILLLCGIISTAGMFIPIGYSGSLGYLCICPVYLIVSNAYFSPYLVLIGGIITCHKKS